MSLTNAAETALLNLIFKAISWANLADDTATSPATTLTVSLHTAWPGEAGTMLTSECAYTSYARQTVTRSSGGNFTVSGAEVSNTADIEFPAATGGSETAMFFGIGTGVSDNLLLSGVLVPSGGGSLPAAQCDAGTDVIKMYTHGLVADDRIVFFDQAGSTVPAGLTAGTVYFVLTPSDTDTFQVSLTSGGAAVNITADGSAKAYQVNPLAISSGVQPKFTAGDLVASVF